jgi:hypothetical protein
MMILRWTAAGLLEAERGFRRIRGYRHMPKLVSALQEHERKLGINHKIDAMRESA